MSREPAAARPGDPAERPTEAERPPSALVHAWAVLACERLTAARHDLDALNVFPVPDADTGTNLLFTAVAAKEALDGRLAMGGPLPAAAAIEALASGAFQGARGNSGVIVSQLLRVAADTAAELPAAAMGAGSSVAETLTTGLDRAARAAFAAVGDPVEGTILTGIRAAADAAAALTRAAGDDRVPVRAVVTAAADAAWRALAESTGQLRALADAGVVDAGAAGLCLLLDALCEVVGERPERAPLSVPPADREARQVATFVGPEFEVMYLLDAPDDALPALRGRLRSLGDSLVVVGGHGSWNVHVHVDDAGAAIEAALEVGRPHRLRVTSLLGGRAPGHEQLDEPSRAVVAYAAGPGLAALFTEAGAVVVEARGSALSDRVIVEAVLSRGATEAVLLPNDPSGLVAAESAAASLRRAGLRAAVIPTRAQVQGLAAVAVGQQAVAFDDDVVAMSAAAGHTRHGAVTVATRAAMTTAGPCREGDTLGIVDGDFALVGGELRDVAVHVVERLLAGGGELVTLVTGDGCEPDLAATVVAHLDRTRPDVEVCVYAGGQPRYPVLIGVE